MQGKLIVIEGSDASGKATQSQMLFDALKTTEDVVKLGFPVYDSPTGKLVSMYLGKLHGYPEFGIPGSISPKIASTWYATNRYEHKDIIQQHLANGRNIICDRYVESNMGHQGGKIADPWEREDFFRWCEELEYDTFGIPRADAVIFLHMPWEESQRLASSRGEKPDGHEADPNHLRMAEETYLQLAKLYGWYQIECCKNGIKKDRQRVHGEIKKLLNHLFISLRS